MYFKKALYQNFFRGVLVVSYLFFFLAQFNAVYFSLANYYEYATRTGNPEKKMCVNVASRKVSSIGNEGSSVHRFHLSIDKRFEQQHLFCRIDMPYYLRTVRFALVDRNGFSYSEHPVTAPSFHCHFRGPPAA